MSSLDTRQMELHEGTVAFVGSYLDVVPANPETWERNPFKLAVEVGGCPERFNFINLFTHLCRETSCMVVVPLTVSVMLL